MYFLPCIPASQGLLSLFTSTCAVWLICLPMLLNVIVAEVSSKSRISPYGNRPDFTNAWKPLQIPSINPPLLSRACTASFIAGFLSTDTIYLAEPSGSSPAENPPGIIIILAAFICSTNAAIDSLTACSL